MDFKETKIKRETKFKNDFLELVLDDVKLPNGQLSQRVLVKHIGAAAMLALTADNEVLLVKQYRYALSTTSLEIPAGKKDTKEEDGLTCALRELNEETGYTSTHVWPLGRIHTAIGFSDEMIELFVAEGCTELSVQPKGDDDEFVEVVKVSFKEALDMVERGEITDVKTAYALMRYHKSLHE